MNLLDFHSRLSSPSQDRVNQFSQNLMIFHLLNGGSLNENELIRIDHDGYKVRLEFTSPSSAKIVEDKIAAQIVPGICGAPLYGIVAVQEQSSLTINFVEL